MSFTRNDLKTNTGTTSSVTAAATASANLGELCCLTGWFWDNGATAAPPATFSDGVDTYTLVSGSHQVYASNFHTFEYWAILSRGVTTYAPSFTISSPGSSREWRVAFTHQTPSGTPSVDQCVGAVNASNSTSTDSGSTSTTDATAELAHAAMISDAAGTNIGVTDPDATAVPSSGWLAGGLYRIQNNSANQAGSAEEYNGVGLHAVAARYHSGQSTTGHQASMIVTYKTAAGAVDDYPASPHNNWTTRNRRQLLAR